MEQKRKAKRQFTPEQKANIVHQIETNIKNGMSVGSAIEKQDIAYSLYNKWKKQLAVGIKSSLRNGKAPVNKEIKQMERKIARLEAIVISQAQAIADLKKETNWE
jgi:transposase-like protein